MKIWHIALLAVSLGLLSLSCENNEHAQAGSNEVETAEVNPGSGSTATALAATGDAIAAENQSGILETADGNVWYGDWNTAAAVAQEQHKPMYIHFTADWCTWCRKMEAETYTEDVIKERFKNWVLLKVDTEAGDKEGTIYLKEMDENQGQLSLFPGKEGFTEETLPYRDLAQVFGATGIPTLSFIDTDGILVYSNSSYRPAEELGQMLDYFHDEVYKETD